MVQGDRDGREIPSKEETLGMDRMTLEIEAVAPFCLLNLASPVARG